MCWIEMAASGDNFDTSDFDSSSDTSGYSGGESEAWILCCIMSFIEFL